MSGNQCQGSLNPQTDTGHKWERDKPVYTTTTSMQHHHSHHNPWTKPRVVHMTTWFTGSLAAHLSSLHQLYSVNAGFYTPPLHLPISIAYLEQLN